MSLYILYSALDQIDALKEHYTCSCNDKYFARDVKQILKNPLVIDAMKQAKEELQEK